MKYEYRVTMTMNGKRLKTDKGLFKSKAEAEKYKKETAKFIPGSRPRVVKEPK